MPDQEYVRIDVAADLPALDYPGAPPPRSGVLEGDRFWPGRRADRLDHRSLVLAIGANAVPAVLAGKLRRAGATGLVPIVRAEVEGLAIGHSAHVNRGGYVPAAPYIRGGTLATWGLWLTDEQRAAVDATEPNYTRVRLRATDHPLRLEDRRDCVDYEVYASRWGVLGIEGVPLPLDTQVALHTRLADVAGVAELVPWGDAPSAVRALVDPDVRARVRRALVGAGLVTPGLGG